MESMTESTGAHDGVAPIYPVTARAFGGEPTRFALTTVGEPSPRVAYGIGILAAALRGAGLAQIDEPDPEQTGVWRIIVAPRTDPRIRRLEEQDVLLYNTEPPAEQGYYLSRLPADVVVVTAIDDSGLLYGAQELAREVEREGRIPLDLDRGEGPDLVVRGPAIGLQKTTVEPERQVYEYPVTPDRFGWFYDREHWTRVLDELFEQRSNIVYLWSGHPFSSFVELPDYPEALEVTREELALNRETLNWLLGEADRRGIQLMLHFYNIHIPLTFSRHHGIPAWVSTSASARCSTASSTVRNGSSRPSSPPSTRDPRGSLPRTARRSCCAATVWIRRGSSRPPATGCPPSTRRRSTTASR
jgi:hypothetical protein